jgi:8-oxo-dGTP pyrophosphatase MutT (NUDIX family)
MAEQVHVVTAFLRHAGSVLLLRRGEGVGSYRGRWAAVSGYLEEPTALAQALREIEEETGIDRSELHLVRAGVPLAVADPALARQWVVHPFLFDLAAPPTVRLDWEHSASRWVEPAAFAELPTVPRLAAALEACWPEAFAADREDRGE